MSLPTYARFFNKEGDLIGTHFVNVGWWIEVSSFTYAVVGLPSIKGTEYAELYGIIIPKELLPKHESKEWRVWRDQLISFSQSVIPNFNEQNHELKLAIRELYTKQQSEIK